MRLQNKPFQATGVETDVHSIAASDGVVAPNQIEDSWIVVAWVGLHQSACSQADLKIETYSRSLNIEAIVKHVVDYVLAR